jgi:hypothetical protein
VQFNAHLMHPGDIVFEHASKMGLEGIVSKAAGLDLPFWAFTRLAVANWPRIQGLQEPGDHQSTSENENSALLVGAV